MDGVRKTFDKWAQNGKAEEMEEGHGKNVSKFLKTIPFDEKFTFLDVGCGNGWVVRKIAEKKNCKKAIGIDKSKKMITQAKKKIINNKESFFHTDIESWEYTGKFNYIFSMESLYYADSIEIALERIYKLLKPGGEFFCGTDFYTENKSTARWSKIMKIQMHHHSKKEWKEFFKKSGLIVKTKQIKDSKSNKKWQREFGTLFITGTKPEK
ncbi:MAG: class I SAM-dependent methyltransferase [Thaumarchaeota archaeon]|jgi:SAM-dependent methyltransferase|nr:class I SAM-dependent methyltransferase [Nitrososphaerota archaeon]MBT6468639.1 class I SAM-dependent methyltransferase [Nitrososphaerota archaeon]